MGGCSAAPDDYHSQADARCLEAEQEAEGLSDEYEGDPERIAAAARALYDVNLRLMRDLQALEPPAEDAEQVGATLDAAERSSAELVMIVRSAESFDERRLADARQRYTQAAEDAAAAARDVGLVACGRQQLAGPLVGGTPGSSS